MVVIFAQMRLSAFILNLLTLVMILVPCRDHKTVHAANAGAQQIYAAIPHEGQADDDCSPLCTCSCCSSVLPLIHTPLVEGLCPTLSAKKFSLYIAPDYGGERSIVWQPPRIG